MLDIIYDPKRIFEIGSIFAGYFFKREIDCVITVETKGIPLPLPLQNSWGCL